MSSRHLDLSFRRKGRAGGVLCYSLVSDSENKCCLIWALAREAEEEGENGF